jgi:hypothetical protein
MALSVSQQIASIENQLAKLKDQIEEQENPPKRFSITFKYNTTKEFWGGVEPTEELIHSILQSKLEKISEAMTLYWGLELVEVVELN